MFSPRSVAVMVNVAFAPVGPFASRVRSAGDDNGRPGGVGDRVTWKVVVVLLPWASVALQVTVVADRERRAGRRCA